MESKSSTPATDASAFLRALQSSWGQGPGSAELDAAVERIDRAQLLDSAWALKAIRAATLVLAGRAAGETPALPLLRRALDFYVARPLREWEEVMWALDVAVAAPGEAKRLIRTVVVSVRLGVKDEVPWLASLGGWGDATHQLLPRITDKLERLFAVRAELGAVLYRQLVKTLPHLGASVSELDDVRAAPEGLQWLVDCPLTLDIREQIHSRASPANLTLVRAYLLYLEKGDPSGLAALWMAQKIPEHDRKLNEAGDPADLKRRLIQYTREMEAILTRIYAFDPESPDSVLADVMLWLKSADAYAPPEAQTLIAQCRARDSRAAVITLAAMRQSLAATLAAAPAGTGVRLLYLDLELEKLGYLLFGEVVNVQFEPLTTQRLSEAVEVLRAMMVSENIKGWNSPRLAWLSRALVDLSGDPRRRLAQLMVLVHQINDEISRVGLIQYQDYSDIVRRMLQACQVQDVETAVNKFVDGLIRGTTLQHTGELALRVHHVVLDALESAGSEAAAGIRAIVEQYHSRYEDEAARAAFRQGAEAAATPMWICRFQAGLAVEPERSADILGRKGANLCAMCALGIPVPPGFVVGVGACERYMSIHALDPSVHAEIREAMGWLERVTGRRFGGPANPLLVSVRSGAPASMPGMLDTILNVGMTDEVACLLADDLRDETAAIDSYLHFLRGYAKSVLAFDALPRELQNAPTWPSVAEVKRRILDAGLEPFWEDVGDQVGAAVEAVFRSWNNPHAVVFRTLHDLPQAGCTAATVQQMVLGNADARSCTGVVFTRRRDGGGPSVEGEYLLRAHGEDLVSGIETPLPVQVSKAAPGKSLAEVMPEIVAQLGEIGATLEARFGEPQEVEFTVESGRLFVLQTRNVRAARAATGTAPPSEAGPAAESATAQRLRAERSAAPPRYRVVARGLGASPGGAVGRIALTAQAARRFAAAGDQAIFVRPTTTPEDLAGMVASSGVLTQRGGVTSHAANNARYMGKPCVVGCVPLSIDDQAGTVTFGSDVLHEGDALFIDGMSGEVGLPIDKVARASEA